MSLIAQSLLVEVIRHPEALPYRDNPCIKHPQLDWGVIDSVGGGEFRVRFQEHGVFVWFSLDDPEVAQWPMEHAKSFADWVQRTRN